MKRHLKSFLINLLFNATMLICAFMSGIILARIFGPEGRGLYATVIGYAPFLGGILSWGFINHLSIKAAASRPEDTARLRTAALWMGLLATLCGTLVMGFTCFVWRPEQIYYPGVTFVFTCAWLLMNLTSYFLTALHRGNREWIRFNLVKTAFYPLYCLGLILLWKFNRISIKHAIDVYLAASACGFTLALVFTFRSGLRWAPDFKHMAKLFMEARPYALAYYSQMGAGLAENFLLILILPPAAIGYLMVALSCAALQQPILYSLGHVVFIESAGKSHATALSEGMISKLRILTVFNLLFYLCLGVLVGYAIPIFYGPAFAPAVRLYWILMPGMLVSSVTKLIDEVFAGAGNPEVGMKNRLIALFLSVIFCSSGGHVFGSGGYALGYSAAQFFLAFFYLHLVSRCTNKTKMDLVKFKALDLSQIKEFASAMKTLVVPPRS
jgi:O-antigen/teichoic acid export membrane protein